jgi:hypothetical protein
MSGWSFVSAVAAHCPPETEAAAKNMGEYKAK